MCGIIGFNWKDENLLKNSLKLLNHRGPDASDYLSDNLISLGHTRLSIIDLSEKGSQPMCNEDGSIWITFNGEIFNFKDIKADLIKKGHVFKSETDTEVLIHGYEEYGYKLLDKLNGQFAFCIYDKKKKQLFLARDRIGINPLYYYFKNGKFIFGSELKVILKSGLDLKINDFAKNFYLVYGHTPRKQSIMQDVYKLEPGHYMVFDLNSNKIESYKKYWDLKFTNEIKDEKKAVKELKELLDNAVKIRLISDVPVGAFLSGGVDSSAVVAYASKYKKNLNTFSVKFDYQDFDESVYGDKISKLFKTKHKVVQFTAKDVDKLISDLSYHYCEPFGDSSMIPTFLVSKVARTKVTVSLSGDGGDELFAGYDAHKHFMITQLSKYYPAFTNRLLSEIVNSFNLHRYMKSYFEIAKSPPKNRYSRIMTFLFPQDIKEITGMNPIKFYLEYQKKEQTHWLNTALWTDLKTYLPEDILIKVDRASLGNSLESRPPLLDHRLIEFACKLDPSLKLKRGEGKYIFKKALEDVLPKEILYRKKMGFAVPLKHYFKKELKKYVEELEKTDMTNYGLKNIDFKKFNNEHILIWRYLMYKKWYDQWIK
jgi:asparagine synthase (glutamine-hydrolysing)